MKLNSWQIFIPHIESIFLFFSIVCMVRAFQDCLKARVGKLKRPKKQSMTGEKKQTKEKHAKKTCKELDYECYTS